MPAYRGTTANHEERKEGKRERGIHNLSEVRGRNSIFLAIYSTLGKLYFFFMVNTYIVAKHPH